MAYVASYFVLAFTLGIFSLHKAEGDVGETQRVQQPYYKPGTTSSRDYGSQDDSEENALPAYYNNNFDCTAHRYAYGMYADLDFQCQVYHVCHNNRKESFMCPKGTLFNQQILSCDHWYSVRCQDSPNFYSVNDLLGRASNGTTYDGGYSRRRFPSEGRPYGQQGYGNVYSQDQLTPFSNKDNTTRYGTNQIQGGVSDQNRYRPSSGSQYGRPGSYGNQQTSQFGGPRSLTGLNVDRQSESQGSVYDAQEQPETAGSPFDGRFSPTGSQSSLFDRRQPQPGSSFNTQRAQAGIKASYDRSRFPGSQSGAFGRPGSERSPYGRPEVGSQGRPYSEGDRFSSGRRPSESGRSPFDRPDSRPGTPGSSLDNRQPGTPGTSFNNRQPGSSFDNRQPGSSFDNRQPGSSFDNRQPGSGRYPYGRQYPSSGSGRSPFDSTGAQPGSPDTSFERPQPGSDRSSSGRKYPSTTTSLGSTFDRPQSGRDRYPSGRETTPRGPTGSSFGRTVGQPGSSTDRTQPGSGRYPYGRQTPQTGSIESSFGRPEVQPGSSGRVQPGSNRYPFGRQPGSLYDRGQPGSDRYPHGRDLSQPGSQRQPFGRPGPGSTYDGEISGRGISSTTGSRDQDVQKPIGFTNNQYTRGSYGSQGNRFNQPTRGSGYNNPQSTGYGRGSQPYSRPLSRPDVVGSNEYTSHTSSEWSQNGLQTPHRSPDRAFSRNTTSVFGNHQKSSDKLHTKDRSMLGQPTQPGESSLPSSDNGLKPILVYENHVPVAISEVNSTGAATGDAKVTTKTSQEVPAYKLYYVKDDQIKN